MRSQRDMQVKYGLKFPQGGQIMDEINEPGKALGCAYVYWDEGCNSNNAQKTDFNWKRKKPTLVSIFSFLPIGSINQTTKKGTFHPCIHQVIKYLLNRMLFSCIGIHKMC